MINENSIKKLELRTVLKMAAEYAQSLSAKELLTSLEPSSDRERVEFLLTQTDEAMRLINYYNVYPSFGFDTVRECADKARILSTLSLKELLCVRRMLRTSREVRSSMASVTDEKLVYLPRQAAELYTNKNLEEELDFAIISEDELNDRASDELYRIRTAIRKANDEVKNKLNAFVHSSAMSKYLQDAIITMRSDRYVIPVKAEYKSMVGGLIHDQSASGATYFIEPTVIVNLNNKIKELSIEEAKEIDNILRDFTKRISIFAEDLVKNESVLAELDCIFAKARFASDTKSVRPTVSKDGSVNLIRARHPLIDRSKVVPVSVRLGGDYKVLLVTGPNTGGKTVSLKTIGLFSLMAACGLMLPCYEESVIGIYENVFCDIGDEQSIEQNLSTFSGHIKNISSILPRLNKNTLVLIDEVGAGTEPNEGAALALAITEYIRNSGTYAVITTHYSDLKEYALITSGIENASMEFDPQTFAPTYRLVIGIPGSSNAIEIAKRLGLDESVIASARNRVGAEKASFENVLRRAETLRQQYEESSREIEATKSELQAELQKAKNKNELLKAEREKLLYNSKVEAKLIVSRAQEEAKELLDEIKGIRNKAAAVEEKEIFKARTLARKIGDLKYDIEKDETGDDIVYGEKADITGLSAGDTVFVGKLQSRGTVTAVDVKAKKVSVRVGKMNTTVSADDVFDCADVTPEKKRINKESKIKLSDASMSNEINLLGKNVDEAIMEIDPFIDMAMRSGLHELRIIHGMGTGALRAGLHKYFKTDKRIKEFRLGRYGEGESGVTILTLKND